MKQHGKILFTICAITMMHTTSYAQFNTVSMEKSIYKVEVASSSTKADPVTIGVDLTDKKGIRICEGDSIEWKNESKKEWCKYTFGCYGCWITDSDGNHDYVSEDDYTEELWDEQKKAGQRNISSGLRK